MPTITRTFRIKISQNNKLASEPFKERSSHLVRELLRIFFESQLPGQDILKLKQEFNSLAEKGGKNVISGSSN